MPDIYPDLSNSTHDVKYARRKLLTSDLRLNRSTAITGRFTGGLDGGTETTPARGRIDAFRVGPSGGSQPMNDGDEFYSNPLLVNNNVMVFADGVKITDLDDDGSERFIQKIFTDSNIFFNGAVKEGEKIEIYIT